MKTLLILMLTCWLTMGYSQPPSGGGYDIPNFGVTYEVIPAKQFIEHCQKLDKPIQTIVFELPVTEDYYSSITIGQIVTNWFQTIDHRIVTGDIPGHLWELKIVHKRKWTKQWTQLTH